LDECSIGLYYETKDITKLLDIKKDIDKSIENVRKAFLRCGFEISNNAYKTPKEWSKQKFKKKIMMVHNLANRLNQEQGMRIDVNFLKGDGSREKLF